jgi:hypothetical protein
MNMACLPSASYSQVVVRPFGPVKVKTLPVLASYFDAFNRKTKEQHTGFDGRKIISDIPVIMMREPCTLRFINTSNFANDIFGGGFLMS